MSAITKNLIASDIPGDKRMKVDINDVFDQIVNIQIDRDKVYMLKDIRLDLKEGYEYDVSLSYVDAYHYLCDCLLIDKENNNSQKLVDLFLVHQYLCWCYLSGDTIEHVAKDDDQLKDMIKIVRECFFSYRIVGAFQDCIDQYEILRKSKLWEKFDPIKQMSIMKEAAKSYRNTGDFGNALNIYYECLEINADTDWLQRVELLLKIGKVYRNYLKQTELAKFYVEEAYKILHENSPCELKVEKKYAFICCDTLGQIYRDEKNYKKAESFFTESEKIFGERGGRAYIHEMLMKYQGNLQYADSDLAKDIEYLTKVIEGLKKNPREEVGAGIRTVQLGRLKFLDRTKERSEAYRELDRGRDIAYKYNDVKTVIRSYREESDFFKQEKNYRKYIEISKKAIELASSSNQLVLENEIIKEIIEWSNDVPDMIDNATRIGLIKRRKDIYKRLIEFSKQSIDIVRKGISFSQEKLIEMYGIVLNDFEQILGELSTIIEILNIEIEKISGKYTAYLNTEIQGFTYKSILHKFKNDLPDKDAIKRLRGLCKNIQVNQEEGREILVEVDQRLEAFGNVVTHIRESSNQVLGESDYAKEWCPLDKLINKAIDNFIFYKPQFKGMIQYNNSEPRIRIRVENMLFETTMSEIVNNAFDYMEGVNAEGAIGRGGSFIIDVKVVEEKTVILKCYSVYLDETTAQKAEISMKEGMEHRQSSKKDGSRYGFSSMKFLFRDLMEGQIEILREKNKTGLSIRLPINKVKLEIAKGR